MVNLKVISIGTGIFNLYMRSYTLCLRILNLTQTFCVFWVTLGRVIKFRGEKNVMDGVFSAPKYHMYVC